LGGIARVKVNSPSDPILFSVDGYRVLVMPIFVQWGDQAEAEAEGEAVVEPVAENKPKRKAKEPVAVEA